MDQRIGLILSQAASRLARRQVLVIGLIHAVDEAPTYAVFIVNGEALGCIDQ